MFYIDFTTLRDVNAYFIPSIFLQIQEQTPTQDYPGIPMGAWIMCVMQKTQTSFGVSCQNVGTHTLGTFTGDTAPACGEA